MLGYRTVHNLKVRNKATGVESTRQVDVNGDIDAAKAVIENEPPSRGAPKGFEVVGEVEPETKAQAE